MTGLPFVKKGKALSNSEISLLSSEIVGKHIQLLDLFTFWKRLEGCPIFQTILLLDQGCPSEDNTDVVVYEKFSHVDSGTFIDGSGHGAHTFAICLAVHNGRGILGASITGKGRTGKVIEDNGEGALSWYAEGLKLALEKGYDFVNASLGTEGNVPNYVLELQKKCKEAGISIQISAGNSYEGDFNSLAENSNVFSVGSVSNKNKRSSFSSKSAWLDISCYGEDVISFTTGNLLEPWSGTSQAAPTVTGVLADAKSYAVWKGLDLNVDDLWDIARKTAIDIDEDGPDDKTGYGIINPNGILDEIDRLISGEDEVIVDIDPIEEKKNSGLIVPVIIVLVLIISLTVILSV